jgi:hypothetical protein
MLRLPTCLLGLPLLGALACSSTTDAPGGASGAAGTSSPASGGGGGSGNSGGGSVNGGGGQTSSGGQSAAGTGGSPNGTAGTTVGGAGGTPSGGMNTGGAAGGSAGANAGGNAGAGGKPSTGEPGQKTLRVFWLRPSDVPFDQKYPDGIGKVIVEAQKYYKAELGKTFKVNDPIVETVVGDQKKTWYENTPNGGEKYWWSVTNMENELVRKFGLKNPDSRWMVVGEISAEGEGAGGGGSPGWVILCQHDADGAVGIGGTMNRWYGGMVHELGHAFGLPDSASTDGTPMSGSFYDYPNTHFSDAQKKSILNGGQGSFLF